MALDDNLEPRSLLVNEEREALCMKLSDLQKMNDSSHGPSDCVFVTPDSSDSYSEEDLRYLNGLVEKNKHNPLFYADSSIELILSGPVEIFTPVERAALDALVEQGGIKPQYTFPNS